LNYPIHIGDESGEVMALIMPPKWPAPPDDLPNLTAEQEAEYQRRIADTDESHWLSEEESSPGSRRQLRFQPKNLDDSRFLAEKEARRRVRHRVTHQHFTSSSATRTSKRRSSRAPGRRASQARTLSLLSSRNRTTTRMPFDLSRIP
jgi:hypothetical protein